MYSFTSPTTVHFEVPAAIARVVLLRDSRKPPGGPVVEGACAKRLTGETLATTAVATYGEAVNTDEMCRMKYLPEGLDEVAC